MYVCCAELVPCTLGWLPALNFFKYHQGTLGYSGFFPSLFFKIHLSTKIEHKSVHLWVKEFVKAEFKWCWLVQFTACDQNSLLEKAGSWIYRSSCFTLCVLEVMPPQRPNLVLTTHIPHCEADVFVLHCLYIKTWNRTIKEYKTFLILHISLHIL